MYNRYSSVYILRIMIILTRLTSKGLHAWTLQVLGVPSEFFELSRNKNVMYKIYLM